MSIQFGFAFVNLTDCPARPLHDPLISEQSTLECIAQMAAEDGCMTNIKDQRSKMRSIP